MSIRPGQAKGPYVGKSSDGDGYGIEIVKSLFDPTSGLPLSPSLGDKYLATATANGWIKDYIYEWNNLTWVGTAPANGKPVYALDIDQMFFYNDGAWRLYSDYWFKPVLAFYDNEYGIPV